MKLTIRIWVLIFFILLSIVSIFSVPPLFLKKGVLVSNVNADSEIFTNGLRKGMIIKDINGQEILSAQDYSNALSFMNDLKKNETTKVTFTTDSVEIIGLFNKSLLQDVSVKEIPSTRLKTGLDLQGGARALIKADVPLTDDQLTDLIAVSEQRLNVYGLSDVRFFKVLTSSHENIMGVEIAGSTPSDLEDLIAKQGKFEAKIGNDTVFVGGNEDVTYVGRSGQDAYLSECFDASGGQQACNFQFVIFLSEKAAQRHAGITGNLSVNGSYLSKKLDFYIDGKLTTSLNIGASLKGSVATQIQISGSGSGATRQEAVDAAKLEMKKLQTILITGSLPFKLNIVKIDKISPNLGSEFAKRVFYAGLFAMLAVALLVLIRYRHLKISLALITTSFSEIIIILGVASLIGWNLDLPSIAGIISTVGTGIDSQLVILDESRSKEEVSIAQRIKNALFIIVTAFATASVSLIPLTGFLSFMGIGAASAGLLKGFAVTTLIGITSGIVLTRPAFADMIKNIE